MEKLEKEIVELLEQQGIDTKTTDSGKIDPREVGSLLRSHIDKETSLSMVLAYKKYKNKEYVLVGYFTNEVLDKVVSGKDKSPTPIYFVSQIKGDNKLEVVEGNKSIEIYKMILADIEESSDNNLSANLETLLNASLVTSIGAKMTN